MSNLTYNGQIIEQRQTDNYVNLTQMAKANNVRFIDFTENKQTQNYLKALQESIYAKKSINGQNPLTVVEGFGADKTTWAHPLIAERFMQWIEGRRYKRDNGRKGIVYIYVDNGNNAYKIGFTTDLVKREKQHKTSNPFLELVKEFEVESIDVETVIHEKLKCHRIPKTTEWYNKHPDVLKTVRLICTEALSPQ
jgi:predicted GIY-YIG superfamily endonuclease